MGLPAYGWILPTNFEKMGFLRQQNAAFLTVSQLPRERKYTKNYNLIALRELDA